MDMIQAKLFELELPFLFIDYVDQFIWAETALKNDFQTIGRIFGPIWKIGQNIAKLFKLLLKILLNVTDL